MSLRTLTQPRWLLSTLLIAGAALFTVGVAAERHANDHHTESGTEATGSSATSTPAPSTPVGGDADGGEATTHTEPSPGAAAEHSETSAETVLGINLESNGLVAVAVIISLALAVLTWLNKPRGVLLVTVAFALVFAVFDIAEIAHQIKESHSALAALAAAIALVHLTTAVVAQQRAPTHAS